MKSTRVVATFLFLAVAIVASLPRTAVAQAFPSKAIRLVVPFAPGGAADGSARAITEALSTRLGQPVVVENRGGANGTSGAELVAKSPPDGYTLLLGFDGTMVISPHLYAKLGFDPVRDFAPVTKLADSNNLLLAHPSLPANDPRALIALAKAGKLALNYATGGAGSTPHLAIELFADKAGIAMLHIPYKGSGAAIVDVMSGQVPLFGTGYAAAGQLMKSGKLKAIGSFSATRSPSYPDVPTFVESGFPDLVTQSWFGILAPANTPRAIVNQLQKEIAAVLQLPEVQARFNTLGMVTVGNSPQEYAAQISADLARWGPVVQKAKVKMD